MKVSNVNFIMLNLAKIACKCPQFDVDGTSGLPHGCPGYKDFTIDKIKNGLHAVVPKCQLNSMSYPEGTNDPIHAVFEEYAADQSKWVDDFIPTYEKMLSNGYNRSNILLFVNFVIQFQEL